MQEFEAFGLKGYEQAYPYELSGGMRQRAAFLRTALCSADILLLDEPFGAVDEITRKQMQKEIKGIHQKTGITIIFVTHDINEALTLGTKILVLDQGQIQQFDPPQAIVEHPANQYVERLLNGKTLPLK